MSKKPRKPRTGAKLAVTPQKSSRAVKAVEVDESKHADSGEERDSTASVEPADSNEAADDRPSTPLEVNRANQQEPVSADEKAAATQAPSVVPAPSDRVAVSTSSLPPNSAIQYQSMVPPTDDIDDAWGSEDANDPAPLAPVLLAPGAANPAQEASERAESAKPGPSTDPDDEQTVTDALAPPISSMPPPSAAVTSGSAESSEATAQPRQPPEASHSVAESEQVSATPARSFKPPSAAAHSRPSTTPPPSATAHSRPGTSPPPSVRSAPASSGPATSRPSRAPGSIRPRPVASNPETRPSRVPGSLRPAASAVTGEGRTSVAPDSARSSVAPVGDAKRPTEPDATRSAPAASVSAELGQEETGARETTSKAPAAASPLVKDAATVTPGADSLETPLAPHPLDAADSPATATPIATRTPLSVSRTNEQASPRQAESTKTPVAAFPAEPVPSSMPPRPSRAPLWALLWLTSVAAAGAIGWYARPVPRPAKRPTNCDCRETRLPRELGSALPQQVPVAPAPSLPTPAATESAPATIPSESTAGADTQAVSAVASAAEPASTLPVVVETESDDRIDVVVKSRPNGVRVWRRGKEIGRTPLVIQIGRGERRVFEIGSPGYGTRRLSLNGEKTEVIVNLYAPGVK